MAHLGSRAFDSIGGDVVSTTAFVLEKDGHTSQKGSYLRLLHYNSETEKKVAIIEAVKNTRCGWFYRTDSADFLKLPGKPIAYWLSKNVVRIFDSKESLVSNIAKSEGKNVTTDNARFIRFFWEVSHQNIGAFDKKWLPCAMGGDFRKWFGKKRIIHTIDWSEQARGFYRKTPAGRIIRQEFWDLPGVTWGKIGSAAASFRFLSSDEMYQETAVLQKTEDNVRFLLGLLNSKISSHFLQFLSPTINFQLEDIGAIPLLKIQQLKDLSRKGVLDIFSCR